MTTFVHRPATHILFAEPQEVEQHQRRWGAARELGRHAQVDIWPRACPASSLTIVDFFLYLAAAFVTVPSFGKLKPDTGGTPAPTPLDGSLSGPGV